MRKRLLLLLGALVLLLSSCAPGQTAGVSSGAAKASSAQASSQAAASAEASSAPEQVSSAAVSSKAGTVKPSSKAASKAASSIPKINTSSTVKPDDTPPPESLPGQYQKKNALTAAEKLIYNKLYHAAQAMTQGAIDLGKLDNNSDKAWEMVEKALSALRGDYPDIFWLPNKYLFGTTTQGSTVKHIVAFQYTDEDDPANNVDYPMTEAQRNSFQAAMNTAVTQILNGAPAALSEYERELYIFNWLCKNVSYDNDTLNKVLENERITAETPAGETPALLEIGFEPFTAYGALVKKNAVCEGYSRAFQLLTQKLNIESALITGRSARPGGGADVGHMWNVVKIDGKWYQLDATWADQGALDTNINYEFFNVSDTMMKLSHQYDPVYPNRGPDRTFNLNLPACNYFDSNNYFVKNGMYIKASDDLVAKAAEMLKNAAQSGQKHAWLMFETKAMATSFGTQFTKIRTEANKGLPAGQTIGSAQYTSKPILGVYVSW